MRSVRDMERHAAWYAGLTPEQRAEYDQELQRHRQSLGLEDEDDAEST